MSDPYVRRVGYFWKFHWQSIRRSRITPVPDLPHRHRSEVRMSYQITFKDNCICLESVAVLSAPESEPAEPRHPLAGSPAAGHPPDGPGAATVPGVTVVTSKRALLATGGLKLARFVILKTSKRNWTLKASEIRGIFVFLTTEKSKPSNPRPVKILRPSFPRR